MNHFKFFIYQFILFSTAFLANIYFNKYISPPFTRVDLIAICTFLIIFIVSFVLIDKLYKRFRSIRLLNKILLSIPAFILAIVLIGLLENMWFEFKGERLFF